MILGLDITPARCGWALLDEEGCSFLELGVVAPRNLRGPVVTLERVRRGNPLADVVAAKATGCSAVVVEQLAAFGGDVELGISWGIVVGAVAAIDPEPALESLPPGRWQRMVLRDPPAGEVNEDDARASALHVVRGHAKVARAIARLAAADREHAVAAAMIAMCGFLKLRTTRGRAA